MIQKQPAMITLEDWAVDQFGERAPKMETLRKWAREGLIVPAPDKIGRTWFVRRDARYSPMPKSPVQGAHIVLPASNDTPRVKNCNRLVDRIRA